MLTSNRDSMNIKFNINSSSEQYQSSFRAVSDRLETQLQTKRWEPFPSNLKCTRISNAFKSIWEQFQCSFKVRALAKANIPFEIRSTTNDNLKMKQKHWIINRNEWINWWWMRVEMWNGIAMASRFFCWPSSEQLQSRSQMFSGQLQISSIRYLIEMQFVLSEGFQSKFTIILNGWNSSIHSNSKRFFSGISEQFPSSCTIISNLLNPHINLTKKYFLEHISEQFQSSFRAVSEQLHDNFKCIELLH